MNRPNMPPELAAIDKQYRNENINSVQKKELQQH